MPIIADGNLLTVDKTNGVATASRTNGEWFSTLTTAKNAAQSGDVIVVLPGEYNESNLLKNGVNWYFMPGAVVRHTTPGFAAIFDDSPHGANSAVTSVIDGFGTFIWDSSNDNTPEEVAGGVFYISNPASTIYARGSLASLGPNANCSVDTHVILIKNCSLFIGEFDELMDHVARGGCFAWFDGECSLHCRKLGMRGTVPSSYAVWAHEAAGGGSKNCYVETDVINNKYAAVRWVPLKQNGGRIGGTSRGCIQQRGGKLLRRAFAPQPRRAALFTSAPAWNGLSFKRRSKCG